jgi:oxygen-dependent protoporphyrinogen oxidase
MTVVVVGGGITGLVAAHDLARAGVPTTLVEESDRLGGKIQTARSDGFLIESGPDSFIRFRPDAVELVRELGLEHALIRPSEPRAVHVVVNGRLERLPEGMGLGLPSRLVPLLTTDMFSLREKLRLGLDVVKTRGPLEGDIAIGALLRRRLGDAFVDRLAGPLLGGVYGTPIDELSLLAVAPRLRDSERDHRSLLLATLASRRTAETGGGESPFATLEGGVGQLVDALVEELQRSDRVRVRLQSRVVSLERLERGADVLLAGGEAMRADAVVLSTPGPVSVRLLERAAPAAAEHVRSIPHGSTAVVSLAFDVGQLGLEFASHGFLVAHGEQLAIDACTVSSLKWAGRAPQGTVLLRVFLGARRPALLAATDAALVRAAHDDLAGVLGLRGDPLLAHVTRWCDCMPQYTVGHLDRVAAALSLLDGTPFVLAGAAYRGAGLPDCIAQGRSAAARARTVLEAERMPNDGTEDPLGSQAQPTNDCGRSAAAIGVVADVRGDPDG